MKSTFYIVCLFMLSLATTEAQTDEDKNRTWIESPKERVGIQIKDWIDYLGPEYSIDDPSAFKKRDSGDPMAVLWLSDGSTEARFMVNLKTNEHHLIVVQSNSMKFLSEMRVDEVPIEKGSEIRLTDKETSNLGAGQDELNIQLMSDGKMAAIWIYYWQ